MCIHIIVFGLGVENKMLTLKYILKSMKLSSGKRDRAPGDNERQDDKYFGSEIKFKMKYRVLFGRENLTEEGIPVSKEDFKRATEYLAENYCGDFYNGLTTYLGIGENEDVFIDHNNSLMDAFSDNPVSLTKLCTRDLGLPEAVVSQYGEEGGYKEVDIDFSGEGDK